VQTAATVIGSARGSNRSAQYPALGAAMNSGVATALLNVFLHRRHSGHHRHPRTAALWTPPHPRSLFWPASGHRIHSVHL